MCKAYVLAVGTIMIVATVAAASATAKSADDAVLSDRLKMQTQEFSEAGQKGDKAILARFLDPHVVFTNEDGGIVTKEQILDGARAAAGNPQIRVTEWTLTRQGDVATSTFVDVLTQKSAGQTLVYRYHSTEVWAKRREGWKMIASQTMVVPQDPPAITLPPAQLDEYVGTYRASAMFEVRITRTMAGLQSSTNGAAPRPLDAEIRDVLFTPGTAPGRRLFQRDNEGHVVGYIARRDGNDVVFRKIL